MPLDPILTEFTTASPSVISYNYSDIEGGEGITTLYGAMQRNTSSTYILTKQQVYSAEVLNNATPTGTPATKLQDINFDTGALNLAQTLKGTMYAQITMGGLAGTGTGGNSIYAIIKVRKWDGTTETEIATATSETFAVDYIGPSGAIRSKVTLTAITIPRTHIPNGESIRITVELWGEKTGTALANVGFGIDPKERTAVVRGSGNTYILESDQPSSIKFFVPFEPEMR